jgi:hypothetical protein
VLRAGLLGGISGRVWDVRDSGSGGAPGARRRVLVVALSRHLMTFLDKALVKERPLRPRDVCLLLPFLLLSRDEGVIDGEGEKIVIASR